MVSIPELKVITQGVKGAKSVKRMEWKEETRDEPVTKRSCFCTHQHDYCGPKKTVIARVKPCQVHCWSPPQTNEGCVALLH